MFTVGTVIFGTSWKNLWVTNDVSPIVYNTGKMGLATLTEPMCLGHESSGIIVQLGSNIVQQAARSNSLTTAREKAEESNKGTVSNRPLQVGDKVALEPGVTCRMCVDCKGGKYQVKTLSMSPVKVARNWCPTDMWTHDICSLSTIHRWYPPTLLRIVRRSLKMMLNEDWIFFPDLPILSTLFLTLSTSHLGPWWSLYLWLLMQ